jgi:hypothetical protein
MPVPLTAGLPSCWAVQAVMMDSEMLMRMEPVMSSGRRPKRSIKQRPVSEAIIMIGVCRALRRSCVLTDVTPTVLTVHRIVSLVSLSQQG